MKMVEFTRPMPPYRPGDRRVMPDDAAQTVVATGNGRVVPSVFDGSPAPPADRPRVGARPYRTRQVP